MEEEAKNEAIYRQLLVQGVLAVILPTEDLRNPCLRTLVADALADMILGNGVAGKACEGWMMWEGITKTIESARAQMKPKAAEAEIKVDTRSRLEKSGLLGEKDGRRDANGGTRGRRLVVVEAFWRAVQYVYVTFAAIRFVVLGLVAASSAPSRTRSRARPTVKDDYEASPMASSRKAPAEEGRRPILCYSVFGLVSQLLDLPSRMPWTSGLLSLVQYHLIGGVMRVGETDGLLDK